MRKMTYTRAKFIKIVECQQDHEAENCNDQRVILGRNPASVDQATGNVIASGAYSPVLVSDCSVLDSQLQEYVNADVDVNSRVRVNFDEEWIRCMGDDFEADIYMRGTLRGSNGTRNIEVPGYYITGEQSKSASARVRSATELIAILHDMDNQWSDIFNEIGAILDPEGDDAVGGEYDWEFVLDGLQSFRHTAIVR